MISEEGKRNVVCVAFNVADGAAPLDDGSFRSELCLPDWAKEIDFQFERGCGIATACSPRGFRVHILAITFAGAKTIRGAITLSHATERDGGNRFDSRGEPQGGGIWVSRGSLFERRDFAMAGALVKHPLGDLLIDTGLDVTSTSSFAPCLSQFVLSRSTVCGGPRPTN